MELLHCYLYTSIILSNIIKRHLVVFWVFFEVRSEVGAFFFFFFFLVFFVLVFFVLVFFVLVFFFFFFF